jgi:hypothetical protein
MTLLLALLSGLALADTDTFTATVTATSTATVTATATRTATATSTPSITPTPAINGGDDFYSPPKAIANLMRLYEMDRSGPYADGLCDVVQVNETPAPYWTPDPWRRAVCVENYDAAWPLQHNTGAFAPGKGLRIQPLDTQCYIRYTGATKAIWLASPAGVASMWVGLWAQPE